MSEYTQHPSEPITVLGETIPAGGEKEFTYKLGAPAIIRNIRVYNYEAEGFDLKYYVKIYNPTTGKSESLFNNIGSENNYIAGNDSEVNWDLRTELETNHEVRIRIVNEDPNNDYLTNLQLELDYEVNLIEKIFNY